MVTVVSCTTIVVHSRDNEGVRVDHEVNLPNKPLTVFIDNDDGTVLVR